MTLYGVASSLGPGSGVAVRRRRGSDKRMPFFPTLVVVAIVMPEAFGFIIADFRLTPARLAFLVLSPLIFASFVSLLGSVRYRFAFSDLFMPLAAFWTVFALSRTEGASAALKSGGVLALEFISPYLVMRCMLQNARQTHRIVRLFCIIAAATGPIAAADTISGHWIVHDTLGHLTGYRYFEGIVSNVDDYYRLGLFRAESIYEHPILLGIVMCYALLLTRDLDGPAKAWCRIGSGIGLFLSLSSAPWQGLVIGIGLMMYSRIFGFPRRWLLLVAGGAFFIAFVFLATSRPFGWIFSHLSLDPGTGYYRLLIWQYAGADAMQSPLFGIGLVADWIRDDWMGASIDSYWLVLALHFGIPCSVMTAFGLIGSCTLPVRQTAANAAQIGVREVKLAETFGIILFLSLFLGFTVHFWGVSSMLIGAIAGMRAYLGEASAVGFTERLVLRRPMPAPMVQSGRIQP